MTLANVPYESGLSFSICLNYSITFSLSSFNNINSESIIFAKSFFEFSFNKILTLASHPVRSPNLDRISAYNYKIF